MFKPSYAKYAALRDSKFMTDYYVGEKTKINKGAISKWKNGKAIPRRTTIDRLASFFRVDSTYFYED